MPTSLSAKKRVRQNASRRSLNRWRMRNIKEQIKTFLNAVQAQDAKTAEVEFRKTCGILDKMACTSTLHRNYASRRKSRLHKRLKALQNPA